MKKILYLLLIISLSLGFASCSSDDGLSKTEYADKMSEYVQLQIDINNKEQKLAKLIKEAEGARGGRYLILQEQINAEMGYLKQMRSRLSLLKKELGIK